MTTFHAAIVHADQTVTYCGTVDQEHVDEARRHAELDDTPRVALTHPRCPDSLFIPREDGDLDHYEPVDQPFTVRQPDPNPLPDLDVADDGEADEPRGASSGTVWISGAIRIGSGTIGGAMDYPNYPPRAVEHTTESPAGGKYLESISSYLIRVGSEPQLVYCPVTDRVAQLGPLNQSARALRNDGSRRTNREGKVCIQTEVLGYASKPWTKGFDPAEKPVFRKMQAAKRSWGIPDVWPAGKPPATAAAAAKGPRSRKTWETKGGVYAHGQTPGQNHWDPGAIDTSIVPGKPSSSDSDGSKPAPKPTAHYEPFPGAAFFHGGRHSAIVTAMGKRLVAEGCGAYRNGPGPDWTNADRESYRRWQVKYSKAHNKGWTGDALDGIPGKESWDALRVPRV
ncbi:peptidoglycan-binding protein [Streptomyces sp. NPDC021098]|uniref:peptidoglycan-binding protein n=1 Tax=unclassified Streptomyces TaxID=2593676 RepID=UPI0037A14C55